MRRLNEDPQVTIKPEEDARLPVLEAEIEREWRNHRKVYVKNLLSKGELQSQVQATALQCVRVQDEYQNRGLNPDQAREAMQCLIHPEWDRS